MLTCAVCDNEFPPEAFAPNPSAKSGLSNKCKACFREQVRVRYRKDDMRKYYLKYRYGLTPEEYEEMYLKRSGQCDICKIQFDRLHVDHDHSCCPGKNTCGLCVRGLLCGNCNRAIGLLNDDLAVAKRAVDYLGEK